MSWKGRTYEQFLLDLEAEKVAGDPSRHSRLCNCDACNGRETTPIPPIYVDKAKKEAQAKKQAQEKERRRALLAQLQAKIPDGPYCPTWPRVFEPCPDWPPVPKF